jgi:hypothetical protein
LAAALQLVFALPLRQAQAGKAQAGQPQAAASRLAA